MEKSFTVNFNEIEFKELLKETLREIMQEINPKQAEPEILDMNQAAVFLKLRPTTLYEKTSRKLVPHFKKGNKIYFNRAELLAWILEGKVKSKSELQGEASTYVLNKKIE